MTFATWQDKFSLGIKDIDNDHQSLFDFFDQLHEAYASGNGAGSMDPVFEELFDYAKQHFQREEELMQSIGFPELPSHQARHAEFRERINDLYARFKKGEKKIGKTPICLEILGFLKNWLHFHILEEDMMIKKFIDAQKKK